MAKFPKNQTTSKASQVNRSRANLRKVQRANSGGGDEKGRELDSLGLAEYSRF